MLFVDEGTDRILLEDCARMGWLLLKIQAGPSPTFFEKEEENLKKYGKK